MRDQADLQILSLSPAFMQVKGCIEQGDVQACKHNERKALAFQVEVGTAFGSRAAGIFGGTGNVDDGTARTQVAASFGAICLKGSQGKLKRKAARIGAIRGIDPVFGSDFNVTAIHGATFASLWNVSPTEGVRRRGNLIKGILGHCVLATEVDAEVIHIRTWSAIVCRFSQVVLGDGNVGEDHVQAVGKAVFDITGLGIVERAALLLEGDLWQFVRVIDTDVDMNGVGRAHGWGEFKAR